MSNATPLRAAIAALELVLVYVYAGFVLSAWPWTQAAGAHLGALVMRPLTQLATGFVSHLPGFVFIAVVVILAHFVLKAVTRELDRRRAEQLQQSLRHPHPESLEMAEAGFPAWAEGLPDDASDLIAPGAGEGVRWTADGGWVGTDE